LLPDLVRPGLDLVFVGTAVADRSAEVGHYYAGPGNSFWQLLAESSITPRRIEPRDDATLLEFGVGLTDLVKKRSASTDAVLVDDDFDVGDFVRRIQSHEPRWVAFHGKTAARVFGGVSSSASQPLGPQAWSVAASRVFVVPSASGSNRRRSYDGLETRLEWFQTLQRSVWPEQAA
jgi:TDG/mug DNA glycosylase family protein